MLVKNLIDTGAIGNVRLILIQLFKYLAEEEKNGNPPWRVDPSVAGAGHFFDLASHQLDYLDYVFGPVLTVKSVAINQAGLYKAEDYVSAEFTFKNNIAGTGVWCFSVPPESSRDTIEIIGDKGSIKFTTFSFEPIVVLNESGRTEYINERPEHVQYNLIGKIVDSLNGKGESPSTGLSGARTSKVMDEIVGEYYGRKGVKAQRHKGVKA
jgi:predicted dehydrogenase